MIYYQYQLKFYLSGQEPDEISPTLWEVTIGIMNGDRISTPLQKLWDQINEDCKQLAQNERLHTAAAELDEVCQLIRVAWEEMLLQRGWILLFVQAAKDPDCSYFLNVAEEKTDGVPVYLPQKPVQATGELPNAKKMSEVHNEVRLILDRLARAKPANEKKETH